MGSIQQAVILCGGQGKRLMPYTKYVPKPMVSIDNRPFLEFILENLSSKGIKRYIILSGYLGDKKSRLLDSGKIGILIFSILRGPTEWDTAKRLWESRDLIDENFLFLYSDNYINLDLKKLEDHHFNSGKPLSTLISKEKNGNIAINESSEITKYDLDRSDPNMNLVEIGFMIANKSRVIDYYDNKNSSFSKIIHQMTLKNSVRI